MASLGKNTQSNLHESHNVARDRRTRTDKIRFLLRPRSTTSCQQERIQLECVAAPKPPSPVLQEKVVSHLLALPAFNAPMVVAAPLGITAAFEMESLGVVCSTPHVTPLQFQDVQSPAMEYAATCIRKSLDSPFAPRQLALKASHRASVQVPSPLVPYLPIHEVVMKAWCVAANAARTAQGCFATILLCPGRRFAIYSLNRRRCATSYQEIKWRGGASHRKKESLSVRINPC